MTARQLDTIELAGWTGYALGVLSGLLLALILIWLGDPDPVPLPCREDEALTYTGDYPDDAVPLCVPLDDLIGAGR